MIKNRQKKITVVSLLLTLFFLITFLCMIAFYDDVGEMAAPVLFMSIFLFITCLFVTLMFWKRSRMIDRAMENGDFIARWKFSVSEWERYVTYEYSERNVQKKTAFFFLSVIIIIIFTIFIFVIEDAKMAMFLAMLGLIGILSLFAFVFPFMIKKLHKAEEAEVLILPEGILLNKQFHSWHSFSSELLSAEINEKPFKHLEVVYSYVTRYGKQPYTVFVPVPESADAEAVVERLKKENELK